MLAIVEPSMDCCFINKCLKSMLTDLPVVAPQVTILPPLANNFKLFCHVSGPMCSKTTSTPLLFVISFIIST